MKEPFVKTEEQYMLIESWKQKYPQLAAGFSTKNGGVGTGYFTSLNIGFHVGDQLETVRNNKRIISERLSFPISAWVGAEQTHQTHIHHVTSSEKGKGALSYETSLKATDGLFTNEKGILLTLCYADCVPLYFLSPSHGMVGLAHAGWKGTVHGIAAKMVEAWKLKGIEPAEIQVIIGPSICSDCYVVDDKVIDLVRNVLEENDEKPYNLISEGQYQLDLKQLNRLVLEKAGIPKSQIEITSFCTSCNEDLFFSHRRDGGNTGRMMSFIGWKEDNDQ